MRLWEATPVGYLTKNKDEEFDKMNDAGKIDYNELKHILFETPAYKYLRTGEVIGKCKTICKQD